MPLAAVAFVMETEPGRTTIQPLVRAGELLAVRVTVPVNPLEGVIAMVPVVEPPGATVALVGLTVRAKEPVGVTLPTVSVMEPVEVVKLVSPEYVAVMVCEPAVVELKL